MVSSVSIIFMCISLLLAVLFPVALAIVFYKKEKFAISAFFVGVLMMFVSQFLIRIPLLQLSAGLKFFRDMASNTIVYALFLGVTAGLFEETARYLGFKLFLRKRLEWKNGIAYGIGHGGIESILLVGLAYLNNIIYSVLINTGAFDILVSPKLQPETAKYIKDALINTASTTFLLAGVERVLTMVVQIALSLIVLYAVVNRKFIYYIYAVLLHMLLDSPLVLFGKYVGNPWIIELYILACAAAAAIFIFNSRNFRWGGDSTEISA